MSRIRPLLWILLVVAAAGALLVGELAREMHGNPATQLIANATTPLPPQLKWFETPYQRLALHILLSYKPTPEDVAAANHEGHIHVVSALPDPAAGELLDRYIQRGADPNRPPASSPYTPLQSAVMGNDLRTVRLLIEHGARRDLRDPQGRTLAELARDMQAKFPEQDYSSLLRYLGANQAEAGSPATASAASQ